MIYKYKKLMKYTIRPTPKEKILRYIILLTHTFFTLLIKNLQ
jgi:hypothetical protein